MNYKKIIISIILFLAGLVGILSWLVWAITFHPSEIQAEPVTCTESAPVLKQGQSLKALIWNVQFMAGKDYVFWFDVPGDKGIHERPSATAIKQTIAEVARVIREENPDIILLQEVDIGAARTDNENQMARLQALLAADIACSTYAYYWKADYVPHPRVMGSAGTALVILSKYKITSAKRHKLAPVPADLLTQQFSMKRAILEVRMPIENGAEFVALNTHLEAFTEDSNVMELQVEEVNTILSDLTDAGLSWIIGGDFNLLPPDANAYESLPVSHQQMYKPQSEIASLYDKYQAVPSIDEVLGSDNQLWFTHESNDPIADLDRTLDYLFLDNTIQIGEHYIRKDDTMHISDHLPVIVEFHLTTK